MIVPSEIVNTPENISNLNELIKQIGLGQCCVFVGAGLSKGAGYPLLGVLIDELKKAVEEKAKENLDSNPSDLPLQIEKIRISLGEDRYRTELLKIFDSDNKYGFLEVHQIVSSIPFSSWITTNYDSCLENAMRALYVQPQVDFFPDLDPTLLRYGHIFHIHGVIRPNDEKDYFKSIILSRSDYDYAYKQDSVLCGFLQDLFRWRTVVFTGYSLNDPELVSVMRTAKIELEQRGEYEYMAKIGKRKPLHHFIIIHEDDMKQTELISELELLPIYFTGDKDVYSGLTKTFTYIRNQTNRVKNPDSVDNREWFED
jgi:hypothetical protein